VKKAENFYTSLLNKFTKAYSGHDQDGVKNRFAIICAMLLKETVNLSSKRLKFVENETGFEPPNIILLASGKGNEWGIRRM
jgi:hypothetical protein